MWEKTRFFCKKINRVYKEGLLYWKDKLNISIISITKYT